MSTVNGTLDRAVGAQDLPPEVQEVALPAETGAASEDVLPPSVEAVSTADSDAETPPSPDSLGLGD